MVIWMIEHHENKSLFKLLDGQVIGVVRKSAEPNGRGDAKRVIWVAASKFLSKVCHERDRADAEHWLDQQLRSVNSERFESEPKSEAEILRDVLEQIKALTDGLSDEQLANVNGLQDGEPCFGLLLLNARDIASKALEV